MQPTHILEIPEAFLAPLTLQRRDSQRDESNTQKKSERKEAEIKFDVIRREM